jgi:hypothetical protein
MDTSDQNDDDRKVKSHCDSRVNPVQDYAPLVYMHPNEPYGPMRAGDFIRRSSLRWENRGAIDSEEVWPLHRINAYRLGHGGYTEDRYNTTQNLHPETTRDRGFYLDLEHGDDPHSHEGYQIRRGRLPIRAGEMGPPVYYDYRVCDYVVYWFHFARSVTRVGNTNYEHDGDWEHIAVLLNNRNKATDVRYFSHRRMFTVKARDVEWAGAGSTHPVVYTAWRSHASYPNNGRDGSGQHDCGAFCTDQTGKGHRWDTWLSLRNLDNVNSAPWYGYGGSWGRPDDVNSGSSGPQGPHPRYKVGLHPEE